MSRPGDVVLRVPSLGRATRNKPAPAMQHPMQHLRNNPRLKRWQSVFWPATPGATPTQQPPKNHATNHATPRAVLLQRMTAGTAPTAAIATEGAAG
jgi:hypothetical protein